MTVLLLDFEATGIDTSKERITEVGAMITSLDFKEVHATFNTLVYDSSYPALTKEVIGVTGITAEMLASAPPPEQMFTDLSAMVLKHQPQFVVAYNKAYDESLFRAETTRGAFSMLAGINQMLQVPWLCAMVDVEQNLKCKSWKLMHVALDHGVAVNPKELHRAINDVELMRQMLVELGTTAQTIHEYQTSPWIYAIALTRPPWEDNGESTNQAKSLGFAWQQAKGDDSGRKFEKRWVKRMKQKDWVQFEATAPIKVKLV